MGNLAAILERKRDRATCLCPLPDQIVYDVFCFLSTAELLRAIGMWEIYGIPRPNLPMEFPAKLNSGAELAQYILSKSRGGSGGVRRPITRHFSRISQQLSDCSSENIRILKKHLKKSSSPGCIAEAAAIFRILENSDPENYRYKFPKISSSIFERLVNYRSSSTNTESQTYIYSLIRVVLDNEKNRKRLTSIKEIDNYVGKLTKLCSRFTVASQTAKLASSNDTTASTFPCDMSTTSTPPHGEERMDFSTPEEQFYEAAQQVRGNLPRSASLSPSPSFSADARRIKDSSDAATRDCSFYSTKSSSSTYSSSSSSSSSSSPESSPSGFDGKSSIVGAMEIESMDSSEHCHQLRSMMVQQNGIVKTTSPPPKLHLRHTELKTHFATDPCTRDRCWNGGGRGSVDEKQKKMRSGGEIYNKKRSLHHFWDEGEEGEEVGRTISNKYITKRTRMEGGEGKCSEMEGLNAKERWITAEINEMLSLLTTISRPFCIKDGDSTVSLGSSQNTLLCYVASKEELKDALIELCDGIEEGPHELQKHIMWLLVNISIDLGGAEFISQALLPRFQHLREITFQTSKRMLMLASNLCYHTLEKDKHIRQMIGRILVLCSPPPEDPVASKCYQNVLMAMKMCEQFE